MADDVGYSYYQCSECYFFTQVLEDFINHPCGKQSEVGGVTTFGSQAQLFGTESASSALQSASSTESATSSAIKWDDNNTKLLIDCYSQNKHLMRNGKTTKKALFERVAEQYSKVSDVKVTRDQCLRKWNKLEQSYKTVEDNNRQTGRQRKDWKFLEEMSNCMKGSPKINPSFTLDTSAPSTSASPSLSVGGSSSASCSTDNLSDSDSDSEVSVSGGGAKPKLRVRKRKSKSSATEMLEFLKEYSDKREKAEEQKVAILREMHEEKKSFFSQFLEAMKKNYSVYYWKLALMTLRY